MAITKANENVVSLTNPTFAGVTTLTGKLALVTGSTSQAPMQFTAGPVLTTATAGVVEFDGTDIFITNSSAARKKLFYVDGTNAPGTGTTYSISVGGNAATTTNGVVTTGSYSNPSWVTALDAGKITTGTMSGARVGSDISYNAANITAYTINQNLGTTNAVQHLGLGVGTAASATTGEIRATNDITAYYSSDERLKTNVVTIDGALQLVKQMRGVRFDWTNSYMADKGGEDGYFVRKNDIGCIAQEVEAVFPELVGTRADGIKALKYDRMVAVLIEAVKELSDKIDGVK